MNRKFLHLISVAVTVTVLLFGLATPIPAKAAGEAPYFPGKPCWEFARAIFELMAWGNAQVGINPIGVFTLISQTSGETVGFIFPKIEYWNFQNMKEIFSFLWYEGIPEGISADDLTDVLRGWSRTLLHEPGDNIVLLQEDFDPCNNGGWSLPPGLPSPDRMPDGAYSKLPLAMFNGSALEVLTASPLDLGTINLPNGIGPDVLPSSTGLPSSLPSAQETAEKFAEGSSGGVFALVALVFIVVVIFWLFRRQPTIE